MVERRMLSAEEVILRNLVKATIETLARRVAERDPSGRGFLFNLADHYVPSVAQGIEADSPVGKEVNEITGLIRNAAKAVRPVTKRPPIEGRGGANDGLGITPKVANRGEKS